MYLDVALTVDQKKYFKLEEEGKLTLLLLLL